MEENRNRWEKRWNPLRQEWIVYAAHRNSRPWDGEKIATKVRTPSFSEDCYLCPGNFRANGKKNPMYHGIFTFGNDFPVVGALAPNIPPAQSSDLYKKESAHGFAKVICYDPDHSKTMADLSADGIEVIINEWKKVTLEAQDAGLKSAFIFENKGEVTGVSNLHPHCQVYATDFIFKNIEQEIDSCKQYGGNLFGEILTKEMKDECRIIAENENAIAFIPFFSKYAYEVMLMPKRKVETLLDLEVADIQGIAEVYSKLIQQYDRLFHSSFPYVMSVMQAPLDRRSTDYHLYFHFQPPLRSPAVRKYLAGPEIGGGNFMADAIPEISAQRLRDAN